MKISINKSNGKNYSHRHSLSNSTTANFEFVQPLFSRLMMPKSSIKGSVDSFVRLAPMPFPTYGHFSWNTVARYVPIEDVCPFFANLMSRKPYKNYVGTAGTNVATFTPVCVPYTDASSLFNIMFTNRDNLFVETAATWTIPVNPLGGDDGAINYNDVRIMPFVELYNRFQRTISSDGYGHEDIYNDNDEMVYTLIMSDPYTVDLVKQVIDGTLSVDEAGTKYNDYINTLYPSSSSRSGVSPRAVGDNALKVRAALESADYVIINYASNLSTSTIQTMKLTALGKQLRKVLIGLGYQFSNDDYTRVSLLPLFAWYKAYFDEYYPARGIKDWAATKTYEIIQTSSNSAYSGNWTYSAHYLSSAQTGNFSSSTTNYNVNIVAFYYFLSEIASTFISHDSDFLSIHQAKLYDPDIISSSSFTGANSFYPYSASNGFVTNSANGQRLGNVSGSISNDNTVLPSIPSTAAVTDVQLRLLHRLTNMFNRDSLIGNRIVTYMKSHFGSDVLERMDAVSHSAGYGSADITIGDVDSTADTTIENEMTGAPLGSYAGKGVGSGKLTFGYSSDTYGYLIIMGSIFAPMQRYQGCDTQLFGLDYYSLPQQQFDALGYEVTPYSAVFDDCGVSARSDAAVSTGRGFASPSNTIGFGFVPRYSGYKTVKNIVNGDMSLRSLRDQYQPYYADRRFEIRDIQDNVDFGSSTTPYFKVVNNNVPLGGIWHQYQQQDELVNYDRVFYNMSDESQRYFSFATDNFMIHNSISFTEKNPLKPLSISFDTNVSGNDDDMTTNV